MEYQFYMNFMGMAGYGCTLYHEFKCLKGIYLSIGLFGYFGKTMKSNIKECAIFPQSMKIGFTKIAVTEFSKLAKLKVKIIKLVYHLYNNGSSSLFIPPSSIP